MLFPPPGAPSPQTMIGTLNQDAHVDFTHVAVYVECVCE